MGTEPPQTVSYADMAKGMPRREPNPFMLWIHLGQKDRRDVSVKTWELFAKKFHGTLLQMAIDKKNGPRVLWTSYGRKCGYVAPATIEDQKAIIEIVTEISVAEHSFRAWRHHEYDDLRPITIIVGRCFEDFSPRNIIDGIVWELGVTEGALSFRGVQPVSDRGDRLIRMSATEAAIRAIQEKGGKVYIGGIEVEVHSFGEPLAQPDAPAEGRRNK